MFDACDSKTRCSRQICSGSIPAWSTECLLYVLYIHSFAIAHTILFEYRLLLFRLYIYIYFFFVIDIASFLKPSSCIRALVLDDCNIQDEGGVAIGQALAANPVLSYLDLTSNKLESQTAYSVCLSFFAHLLTGTVSFRLDLASLFSYIFLDVSLFFPCSFFGYILFLSPSYLYAIICVIFW